MAAFAPTRFILPSLLMMLATISQCRAELDAHYYEKTCPQAESTVFQTLRNASVHDSKVPARLLRMFFHDCFIRGCDASVLLDSTPQNQAEKDGPPNISLRAFYVIDDAKAKLEQACPRTVSCADIIAIAARDVVVMAGGPYWNVLKGRKDGRISKASETRNLPAPTFNVTQLIQSFAQRSLGVRDMVALSGGHTIGFSHCSSFEARLRNFSSVRQVDPTINAELAVSLGNKCLRPERARNAGQFLDSTMSTFDNNYYKQLIAGKGLLGSDQVLFGDIRTRGIVESFAKDENLFLKEFAAAMIKLGNVGVIQNGEVRLKCRQVN